MCSNFTGVAWKSDGSLFMHGLMTKLPNAANNYRATAVNGTWHLANEGFCGANFSNRGPSQFLFASATKFIVSYVDVSPRLTINGGLSFLARSLINNSLSPNLTDNSCFGAAINPSTGTLLAGMQYNAPKLIRSTNNGASWAHTNAVLGGDNYTIIKGTGNTWFAGRMKSTDDGATWSTMADLPSGFTVCLTTWTAATQNIFAWNSNRGGGANQWYRSSDQGANWTLVLSLTEGNGIDGSTWGPVEAHPSNPDILYTGGTNGHTIRKWDLSTGSATTRTATTLNIFGPGGTPGSYPVDFVIKIFTIDPRHPDIMGVLTHNAGGPRLYRSTNGGVTAWEELGPDVYPMACNSNALVISPYTGDWLAGGSNGTFVIGPTYAQADTIFDRIQWGNYLGADPNE
jgi:hypothetical protein